MNTGLLLPKDILEVAKKAYKQRRDIDKSAYESFIRQIIGWREYQYYIYSFHRERLEGVNYFTNKGKLTSEWYSGNTGMGVVDDAIKVAFNYGYLHHIMRLMVICNFMNLCMIAPVNVFKWFMEFSMDSYEWVMYCNVYSMGIWSDGGVAMRKPYIASDAYISKMSNYGLGLSSKSKEKQEIKQWMRVWYALFYNFINVKQKQIKGTYYAGMIKNWNNKSTQEQKEITQLANQFLTNGYKLNYSDNNDINSNTNDKRDNNDDNINSNDSITGGSEDKYNYMINDTYRIKQFIAKYSERINEFKETEFVKLEDIQSAVRGLKGKFKLFDLIYTTGFNGNSSNKDNDNMNNIKIWYHGNEEVDRDELVKSITGGLKGSHMYIILSGENDNSGNSDKKIELMGNYLNVL